MAERPAGEVEGRSGERWKGSLWVLERGSLRPQGARSVERLRSRGGEEASSVDKEQEAGGRRARKADQRQGDPGGVEPQNGAWEDDQPQAEVEALGRRLARLEGRLAALSVELEQVGWQPIELVVWPVL